ncbi:hypothetical protein J2S43_007851 [Catenuloplanes nepalensis]|uniref:Uncharacterized protein n=1 Tax=Catenuloplanes nepalensis TaxID=587533 RepID=A0ABT9N6M7_9ACTN|nr:hypothetical protein [Catenuloplanes nepalensis]MDP9799339.1 hypothetical protein [Catenuloplanes nepalensis]
MTVAPTELLGARAMLLEHLDMHPGTVPADLDPAEVGIVAGPASMGTDSYHCGEPELPGGAVYSKHESPRDSRPDAYASALDVGEFSRGRATLRDFSLWLVAQCEAGADWTRDIREVIYSPDGKTVKRWDRLRRRSSGDASHLTHTHISWFRDSRGHGALAMVRAYLQHVGILAAPTDKEDEEDMSDLFDLFVNGDVGPGRSATHSGGDERAKFYAYQQKILRAQLDTNAKLDKLITLLASGSVAAIAASPAEN